MSDNKLLRRVASFQLVTPLRGIKVEEDLDKSLDIDILMDLLKKAKLSGYNRIALNKARNQLIALNIIPESEKQYAERMLKEAERNLAYYSDKVDETVRDRNSFTGMLERLKKQEDDKLGINPKDLP